MRRLQTLGLVEERRDEEASPPSRGRAAAELHCALGELERKLARSLIDSKIGRRAGSIAVRRAIHRVIAARHVCDS